MTFGPVGEKSRNVIQLSTASIEAYEGAVRSSKTITSILDFARFLRQPDGGEFAIVGRTERTAYRNIVEPMVQMFGKQHVKYNQGLGQVKIFGRTGYLFGANNEASRTKVQGLTLWALYIDEAATVPESFFNMAYSRLSFDDSKMWLTANPEGRNHWLKVNWLDQARIWMQRDGTIVSNPDSKIDLHRYTYTIDDNDYLPDKVKERLKASYSGIWYLRFILSEWTNAEGAIFDMFDPLLHVKACEVPIVRRLVAVDYGTTNATAAVLLGLGTDQHLYVVDEWRHDSHAGDARWTDGQLAVGLAKWMSRYDGIEWIMVDPSAASFRLQLFADGFMNTAAADNAVVDGIRATASLLSLGNLLITPGCTALIKEIPEYVWDEKATEKGEDKPKKTGDHSIDALRYAIMAANSLWFGQFERGAA